MTNYSNYPRHRLVHNSCIICFSEHTYSWTPLTEKQKKYMLTNYIDSASRIDLKDKDGAEYCGRFPCVRNRYRAADR